MLITVAVAVWELAALADYCLHRRTHIERTWTGESLVHLLLIVHGCFVFFVVIFGPRAIWTALFIVVNVLVHVVMGIGDIWTAKKADRHVSALEQTLHVIMQVCPAVVGADYIGEYPIPSPSYLGMLFTSIAATIVLPYGEEFWRCWSYERNEK